MAQFLILQLDGVLQAWGDHTLEDYRPTVGFPTRSGLLGLLAACLGIDRADTVALSELDRSIWFTVRAESRRPGIEVQKLSDFHTVLAARKVDIRKPSEYPVVSRREYLCDAIFSVALEATPDAAYSLDRIADALKRPHYTPVLGRRSCALSRPLLAAAMEAENAALALHQWRPHPGRLYSDSPSLERERELRLRDAPRYARVRQFDTRRVYVDAVRAGHVSE